MTIMAKTFQFLILRTTVTILDLEYEGTLLGYSAREVSDNLLRTASTNILATKGIKAVQNFKMTILEKDIIKVFVEPKSSAGRVVQRLAIKNISHTLDTIPDIMVSYTWLTSELYERYGKTNKKRTSLARRAKNQAKFALEALVLYTKVLPQLFLNSIYQQIALEILSFLVVVGVTVLYIMLLGFNWWVILVYFFTHKIVFEVVTDIFYNTLRINLILYSFYKTLNKTNPIQVKDIQDIVSKIPALTFLAKRSGVEEFKGVEVEDSQELGQGDVLPEKDLIDGIRTQINDFCKIFQFEEKDLLKEIEQSIEEEEKSEPELAPEKSTEPAQEQSNEQNEELTELPNFGEQNEEIIDAFR